MTAIISPARYGVAHNRSHRPAPRPPAETRYDRSAPPKIARSVEPPRDRLLDDGDGLARRDRRALIDAELLDLAAAVRSDLVLHLHRLDHRDQSPLLDLAALLDGDLEDGALEGRDELGGVRAGGRARTLTALRRLSGGSGARRCRDGAVCGRGGADHLDVEAAAGDLDGVGALDRGLLLVVRLLGLRPGELLQPLLV